MARLHSYGHELASVANDTSDMDGAAATAGATESTTIRTGTYSLKVSAAGVGDRFRWDKRFISSNGNGPYYARVYMRVADLPDALTTILNMASDASASKGTIKLNSDGTLELWDDTGQVGSDSSALSLNQWYRIEIYFYNNTASGFLELNARIDGSSFASTTTDTHTGGVSRCLPGVGTATATNYVIYFDDFAINDTSGSFQNTWPGNGGIVNLRPNAAGDADEWDATTTYEDIDEVTPDDATTIITSSTSGQVHDVNIDDTPAAIGSGDTINVVSVGVRFNESVTTDPDPTFVVRVKASSGGTVEEGSSITANSTTYISNNTSAVRLYSLTLYDLPGASTTAWTKSYLDTAQIGVRLTNTPAGEARVSTLWMIVDFTPASAAVKDLLQMGIISFAR